MRNAREIRMPRHRFTLPMYVGAGGIATGCHYVTTIAAVELLGVHPVAASAVGFSVGALVKYCLNYFVAFRSGERHAVAVPRFLLMVAVMLGLNTLVFALLQQGAALHYMAAQVITTVLLIPPGYLMSRVWVFRSA